MLNCLIHNCENNRYLPLFSGKLNTEHITMRIKWGKMAIFVNFAKLIPLNSVI